MQNDPVNHPAHYTSGKIEVIDFIEDKQLGFHLGNAVKYIVRAGRKDPTRTVEDLLKAIWYLKRYNETHDSYDIQCAIFNVEKEIKSIQKKEEFQNGKA